MADDIFERLKRIAKDEFGISIVKTDNSKTSQMLLDDLNYELASIEKLNKIKEIIAEKNGVTDSKEFGLSYGELMYYLDLIEEVITTQKSDFNRG